MERSEQGAEHVAECDASEHRSERQRVRSALSHGEPTWFVRDKKVFVMYANQVAPKRLVVELDIS